MPQRMSGLRKLTWADIFSSVPESWSEVEKSALITGSGTFGSISETVRRYVNLWANCAIHQYLVFSDIDAEKDVFPSGKFFTNFFDNVYKEMAFYHQAKEWGGDAIEAVWRIVKEQLIRFGLLEETNG